MHRPMRRPLKNEQHPDKFGFAHYLSVFLTEQNGRTWIMRRFIYVLMAVIIFGIASCSKSMTQYDNEISLAEMIMRNNTDSALSLLDEIDPSELEIDSCGRNIII